MTFATGSGASIIDTGTAPIIFELRAQDLPQPLADAQAKEIESATLSFTHQGESVLQYRISEGSNRLDIVSDSVFQLYQYPQSTSFGNTLISSDRQQGIYIDGDITTEDQYLSIENLVSIHSAPWEELYQEEGIFTSLSWPTETVLPYALLLRGEGRQYFLAMDDHFSGYIPSTATEWSFYAPGCTASWTSIDEPPILGGCQKHRLQVFDQYGSTIWSQTQDAQLIPQYGGYIFPEEETVSISAGPAYEKRVLDEENAITLNRVHPPACLFTPFIDGTNPNTTIPKLLGNGVRNAVLNTQDFISPFSLMFPPFSTQLDIKKGFVLRDEQSWLLSWPWEPIIREPGLGAVPGNISKQTQLSYMARGGRTSVANLDFFQDLHQENAFVHPDFLFIESAQQFSTLFSLIDAQEPLRFLGPHNWIPLECTAPLPNHILLQHLFAQQHSFGNGPLLNLQKTEGQWYIDAYAPSWMDVETLMLIGESGVIHAQWEMEDTVRHETWPVAEEAWTIAILTGEHWAASRLFLQQDEDAE